MSPLIPKDRKVFNVHDDVLLDVFMAASCSKDKILKEASFEACPYPLYASGIFHSYMLDKSICHCRDDTVGSILSLLFYF